jgi:HPt (histidine-containing phosphotransfer) domain-containing protein
VRDVEILINGGVNIKQSLEYLGDMEMYDDMLEDFLTEMEKRIVQLENFKEAKDMQNYAILVHAIKGDSRYLGFERLSELALQHEMESKNGNVEFVDNNFNELMQEINKILDISRKYLNNN